MTFEQSAADAASSARPAGRGWLRAVAAAIVAGVIVMSGAQPAAAAPVVVAAGKSGHICGDYFQITSTLKYQLCTWASAGSSPRIWFTAHFSNRGNNDEFIYYVNIMYRTNGSSALECRGIPIEDNQLLVPARGTRASTDDCWINRSPGAYQADVFVVDGNYNEVKLSPTLNVR